MRRSALSANQRTVTGGGGQVCQRPSREDHQGTPHLHEGYGEVYYVLAGSGTITLGQGDHRLRPGSVAVVELTGTHLQSMQLTGGSPWVR